MRDLIVFGAAVLCALSWQAVSHPLCYYDARPTDPEMFMVFCPEQEEGACCNEFEEAEVITWYNNETLTTTDCEDYFRQVRCVVSYSQATSVCAPTANGC